MAALCAQAPAVATPEPNFESVLVRRSRAGGRGDLEAIKKRGVLRVLTRNNSSNYFIVRGQEWGFQLELTRAFAEHLGLRVEMVVPSSRSELIPKLLEGEGDLIAAGMTVTATRALDVLFTHPVTEWRRVIATHPLTVKPLSAIDDLPSFVLHVSHRSTTYGMARELEQQLGVPLLLQDVDSEMEMEEMLRRVSSGEFEATIADENLVELEAGTGSEVAARIPIGEPLPKAWAARTDSPQLHAAASEWLARKRKDGFIKILYEKYFRPQARLAKAAKNFELRADESGRISPFDATLRSLGKEVGIDWRLLAAVAMRESRFDPKAKSPFGACGLMQVMPATAIEHGKLSGAKEQIAQRLIADPQLNLRVGAKYLRWLMERFDRDGIAQKEQIHFALAAYNVGLGHIHDARALAEQIGKNKSVWFDNVEAALRLKADPKWHEKTRLGFCRAAEPIQYVREIQGLYDLYVRHVPFE